MQPEKFLLTLFCLFSLICFSLTLPTIVKAQVVINEVFPNPSDDNDASEWIELFNNSTSSINISGYVLDDIDGGSKEYIIPDVVIEPHSFYLIAKENSKIGLNNSQDSIRLFNNSSQLLDSFSYVNASENFGLFAATKINPFKVGKDLAQNQGFFVID